MRLLELYGDKVLGAIRGLDRIRFRGTFRWLANEGGIARFASMTGILLKDFGAWAQEKTRRLRASCEERARELGVESIYLRQGGVDKERLARRIAKEKGIGEGSICMLSAVEPCWSPAVEGDRESKHLTLRMRQRKCVWIYHYFDDPQVGFGHVRLQSWLPMNVQICLNGRHWLEKQMTARGMAFVKDGNCFPWVEDVEAAQALAEAQLRTHWPTLLDELAARTCPVLGELFAPRDLVYYWSADQTEWASDVMFRAVGELQRIYPSLVRHAMFVSDSPSVMRYFGKRNVSASGGISGRAPEEIVSDFRRRYEGVRVKHWLEKNSLKMYDKGGSVLRFETTINDTRDFRVYRCPDDDKLRAASWQKLRKGVSDLARRCEISDRSNERYADTLADAFVAETLSQTVCEACNPTTKKGRRHRALNPWDQEDHKMLVFLAKGEWALNGFRNKDLRACLYPQADTATQNEVQRLSGRTTRRLSLLRAHGLIRKVPRVNRYQLTSKGRKFAAALIAASATDIKRLMEIAA